MGNYDLTPRERELLDRGLGVWGSDYNDAPSDEIEALREKLRTEPDARFANFRDLIADPERKLADGFTQIYVRAWTDKSRTSIKPTDIAQLELTSLIAWARSRGGKNPFAELALALVCGHFPAEVQKIFGEELLRL